MSFRALDSDFFDELNLSKLLPVQAIPTPLPTWNRLCRDEGGGIGLACGWHVTVAGNTGFGKSLLALNLVASAMKAGRRTGVISLEMSASQLVTRLMAIMSGISIDRLEHGKSYCRKDARSAEDFFRRQYKENGGILFVNDHPISSLRDVEAGFRYLHEDGCRMIVTDYLQLVWTDAQNMYQQIAEVSHTIRGLAKELGVVSVALSQYNRATSAAKEEPIPQGCMGGSAIENDSDQVLLLDHSTYERHSEHRATCRLLMGKNRHGAGGAIPIEFDYRTLRVSEVHVAATGGSC